MARLKKGEGPRRELRALSADAAEKIARDHCIHVWLVRWVLGTWWSWLRFSGWGDSKMREKLKVFADKLEKPINQRPHRQAKLQEKLQELMEYLLTGPHAALGDEGLKLMCRGREHYPAAAKLFLEKYKKDTEESPGSGTQEHPPELWLAALATRVFRFTHPNESLDVRAFGESYPYKPMSPYTRFIDDVLREVGILDNTHAVLEILGDREKLRAYLKFSEARMREWEQHPKTRSFRQGCPWLSRAGEAA